MKCKKTIVSVIVLSSLGLNSSIDNAITIKEVKPVVETVSNISTSSKKKVKSKVITSNAVLYKEELKDMKKKLLKQAKKSNKNATMKMIDYAFESADNRKSMEKDMNEYLKLVAMHLAIMEIESNFNNSVICKNPTTLDIGIMQVNTSVVNYIRKGLKDQSLNPYNLKDNIEMGSYELYTCYKKAKKKHPSYALWYTYAYYNRGLYFEKYNWNYNQTNKRSMKFINTFNKYYKCMFKGGAVYEY